jgi:hypothetical protein
MQPTENIDLLGIGAFEQGILLLCRGDGGLTRPVWGDGNISRSRASRVRARPLYVGPAEWNRGGRMELVCADQETGTVSVLLNQR